MDHHAVDLIGVFDPDGRDESFCYSVNAPTNLWIGALCEDGLRMSPQFMAYILNELIEQDGFNEGDVVLVDNQDGALLQATVGGMVPARRFQAYMARSLTVRTVAVRTIRAGLPPVQQ